MFKDKDWCTMGASKDWCLNPIEILTDTSLDTERSLKILSEVPDPFAAISHLIALERYDLSHSVIRGSFFILVLSNSKMKLSLSEPHIFTGQIIPVLLSFIYPLQFLGLRQKEDVVEKDSTSLGITVV